MRRILPLFALALLLLSGCVSASAPAPTQEPARAVPSAPAESAPPPTSTPVPTPVPTPTPEPTPTPTPEPTSPPWPPYEFGVPLEESEPVEDDGFFDTAAFVGDSRTEGLQLFSGLKQGDFFWARGMNVFKAVSEEYRPFVIDGEKCSLMEVLGQKQYESVYVMLGVNELGTAVESYEHGLSELMDKIAAVQPNAVIYLQRMPPVNDAMCRKNGLAAYINNDRLAQFNESIVRVAAEKKVVLLNTAEVYTGEDGQLPAELAADGCHFVITAYGRWADYLRAHVIDRERYFYSRELALAEQAPETPEQTPEQ